MMPKRSGFFLLLLAGCLAASASASDNTRASPEPCERFDWSLDALDKLKQNQFPSDFYQRWAGKTLRHIRIETGQVFDPANPAENNWLYRSLDKLHIITKPQVIRAQLLIHEGEALDPDSVKESARLLRSRGYLASAYIVPEQVCGEFIDLRVVTRDAWSTEPDSSLSHSGGETKSGFGLSEDNLLGWGTSVSVGYEQMADRSAVNYTLSSPHVFNSRFAAQLAYADKTDGTDKIIEIAKPFYALSTRWAYGVSSQTISQTQAIRFDGAKRAEFGHDLERQDIFWGHGYDITPEYSARVLLGYSMEEDELRRLSTSLLPLPEDRTARYPWIGYRRIENHFGVFKNLRQIQRLEDVALGSDVYLQLGYGGQTFSNPRDTLFASAHFNDAISLNQQHLLEFASHLEARQGQEARQEDMYRLQTRLAYNYFVNEHRRWYLQARWDLGENLMPHEEFTLGGPNGLRGYPLDFQRGNQRYLISLEHRYFSDWHLLNLLRLGAVVFAETGKAWGGPYQTEQETLSNLGVGLRISSSKARIGSVVHLDIAMPTAARAGVEEYQWTISTRQQF
jgi:hypothetical protein